MPCSLKDSEKQPEYGTQTPRGRLAYTRALWRLHRSLPIPGAHAEWTGSPSEHPAVPAAGPPGAHVSQTLCKQLNKFWQIQILSHLTSIANSGFEEIPITWVSTMLQLMLSVKIYLNYKYSFIPITY